MTAQGLMETRRHTSPRAASEPHGGGKEAGLLETRLRPHPGLFHIVKGPGLNPASEDHQVGTRENPIPRKKADQSGTRNAAHKQMRDTKTLFKVKKTLQKAQNDASAFKRMCF